MGTPVALYMHCCYYFMQLGKEWTPWRTYIQDLIPFISNCFALSAVLLTTLQVSLT